MLEGIKDLFDVLRLDAASRIGNFTHQHDLILTPFTDGDGQLHISLAGKLYRIIQKIDQNLLQPGTVPIELARQIFGNVRDQLHILLGDTRANNL